MQYLFYYSNNDKNVIKTGQLHGCLDLWLSGHKTKILGSIRIVSQTLFVCSWASTTHAAWRMELTREELCCPILTSIAGPKGYHGQELGCRAKYFHLTHFVPFGLNTSEAGCKRR